MLRTSHSSIRVHAGHALVEVIVTVLSVTFLLGLAVLGVGCGSGDGPRKTQCINNQHNIGIALIRFEMEKGRYPGWTNSQNPQGGLGGTETGWVFPLLPYLDRQDLYSYYGAAGKQAGATPTEYLKILICPSDKDALKKTGTHGNYVVNTGLLGDVPSEREAAAGVFTRQYRASDDDLVMMPSSRSITDGLATTILFSENIDAGDWTSADEGCVGIAWEEKAEPSKGARIGESAGAGKCEYPRPSSHHTAGGAVVTFCDGHTQFIDKNIAYSVYQEMMTSQGKLFGQ